MKNFAPVWKKFAKKLSIKNFLLFLLSAYRVILAPHLGGGCRFIPSCSSYAQAALRSYPCLFAIKLILKRLRKCHFFGPDNLIDPVMPPPPFKAQPVSGTKSFIKKLCLKILALKPRS